MGGVVWCNQTVSRTRTSALKEQEYPKPVLTQSFKNVGGAGMSIAELWENHKTTTRRLPNDLALAELPWWN